MTDDVGLESQKFSFGECEESGWEYKNLGASLFQVTQTDHPNEGHQQPLKR